MDAFSARRQLRAAALVAALALSFDLLFFAVDTLPATVPVALALALIEWRDRGVPTSRGRCQLPRPIRPRLRA
jgi:hypothetical protein